MKRLICVLAALLCSGCAWTTESIDVPYERARVDASTPVAGANSVQVSVQGTDSREANRDRVSSKKNGFGMEGAPITATNDVAATVGRALSDELAERGFRIGPGKVAVTVAIRRFYSDFKIGFWAGDAIADFDAEVIVKDNLGRVLLTKSYAAQGAEPNIQLAIGANARAALMRAMSAGVSRIVNDPDFIAALFAAEKSGPSTT
jgi:uncharacterized lipoprotein YajG